VVTFLDITDRRRLEDELLNARKLDSLGVLAGGIAHDFNNLLTGILANISLARHEIGDSAVVGELLAEAEAAAQRSKALTQQLLTFSKGGAPLKKVISLREVVLEAASFAVRGSAVRPVYSWASELWAVEADPGQLGQVVQNLVLNAVQAMPAGGTVEVACANVELAAGSAPLPPGRYVRVSVRDQGIGIPPEHVSRIFDPYFSTKQGGTGLGLATVYSIVKRHGGHVGVSSRLGEGTTFDIHLPAAARAIDAVVDVDVEPPRGYGRVLVMDDEPLVRRAAESILRHLGYDVIAVADGAEALVKVREAREDGSPIDVAVLDLTVPGGVGGADAVEAIHDLDPELAAVVSSGYSSDPVMASYRTHGFIGVAAKPYTTTDLARAVYEAMQVRRRSTVLAGRAS
jgi:CheY-like chemotaxis protein